MTKLDHEGMEYLAGLRLAKRAAKEIKDPKKVQDLITNALPRVFPGFAKKRKTIITADLLEKMRQTGMPAFSTLSPGEHDLPPNMARLLENFEMVHSLVNEPEFIKVLPFSAAFGLMFLQDIYSEIALHRFGTTELNLDQMFWAAGATLEWVGKMLKERKPIPLYSDKGRANVELLELIRTIRAHQKAKLTPKEMRQALAFGGYHISDEEALRLFEWRAKKKGQL